MTWNCSLRGDDLCWCLGVLRSLGCAVIRRLQKLLTDGLSLKDLRDTSLFFLNRRCVFGEFLNEHARRRRIESEDAAVVGDRAQQRAVGSICVSCKDLNG